MRQRFWLLFGSCLLVCLACKKEVEKMVVQDKEYSGAKIKQLTGSQKVIVQLTKDVNALYLQEAEYLGTVALQPGTSAAKPSYYHAYSYLLNPLPADLRNRIPMNGNFYVNPVQEGDTIIRAYPTTY